MTREDRERRQMEVIAGIPDGVLSHPPGCAPDPWDGLVRWWHVRIEEVEPLFPAYDHDSEFRVTYINATYDEPDLAPRLVGWERVASTMAFPDEVECPDCDEGEPCKTCEGTHFIYDPGNIAILWRKVAELETWEMGEAHGMRRFTVAAAPVWAGGCRSSPTSNYGKLVWPNDFIVYAVQGLTSLTSGMLISRQGWEALNTYALPAVAITAAATMAYGWKTRHQCAAAESQYKK